MNWVRATGKQDDVVWINVEAATSMTRGEKFTHVYFAGSDEDKVDVHETPEDLLVAAGIEVPAEPPEKG